MKIVITSNPYRDPNFLHAKAAYDLLSSLGADVSVVLSFDMEENYELPSFVKKENFRESLKNTDALVCFGGDGTLLHASKYASFKGIPVLGINIGTMGFMTELEANDISRLSQLVNGEYQLEKRMMLRISVLRENSEVFCEHALNDAVMTKGAVARVIQLSVSSNGREAMDFSGDGVILSSPTGSTAYSMSAGGPIVEPTADAMIITPVCAHSMAVRPIVLNGNSCVEVKIEKTGRKNAFLSVDGGRAFRLNPGDIVRCIRSPFSTSFIHLTEKSFFDILKQKLMG